jgi:hypothetical protein
MNKAFKTTFLMFGIIGSLLIIPEIGNVYAETVDIQGFEIDTTQSLTVIGVGFSAGLLVAYQGYRATSKDWDTLVFLDSVIKSVLVSVPLAVTSALTHSSLGIFEYVLIFGASMGFAWQLRKTMKPTLSSNEAKAIE